MLKAYFEQTGSNAGVFLEKTKLKNFLENYLANDLLSYSISNKQITDLDNVTKQLTSVVDVFGVMPTTPLEDSDYLELSDYFSSMDYFTDV